MKLERLLFASIHGYLDPSNGASTASRDLLELLSARGVDCRVLSTGILDYREETPLEKVLGLHRITLELKNVKMVGPRAGGSQKLRQHDQLRLFPRYRTSPAKWAFRHGSGQSVSAIGPGAVPVSYAARSVVRAG